MRVAAIDIGKPGNLGWAVDSPDDCGTELGGCIATIAEALRPGSVALGFEVPQFVPVLRDQTTFTKARAGEGARPYSAGAGAAALVTSLVTIPFVLTRFETRRSSHARAQKKAPSEHVNDLC